MDNFIVSWIKIQLRALKAAKTTYQSLFMLPMSSTYPKISFLASYRDFLRLYLGGSTREYRLGYGESTEVLWRYSRREVLSEVRGRVSYHALQVSKGLYWFQTGFKPLLCP